MTELSIENLKKALDSLNIAYNVYSEYKADDEKSKMFADSCIKRFEYTFETSWKFMKKYFKLQYNKTEQELTMNNIFRYMEAYGFTNSWLNWKNYYEQRNNTAHEYNIEKSNKLFEFLPNFINDVKFLIETWEKK